MSVTNNFFVKCVQCENVFEVSITHESDDDGFSLEETLWGIFPDREEVLDCADEPTYRCVLSEFSRNPNGYFEATPIRSYPKTKI